MGGLIKHGEVKLWCILLLKVGKGCQRDAKGKQKGYQQDSEGTKGMQKGCQRDTEGMRKGCQRDAEGMPKGCGRDAEGTMLFLCRLRFSKESQSP